MIKLIIKLIRLLPFRRDIKQIVTKKSKQKSIGGIYSF